MKEQEIYGIFPTPIYRSKLNRNFTKKELNFFDKIKCKPNKNNLTSVDNYILERPILLNLKKEINLFVEDYFNKILFPHKSILPYITQSWLNYTKQKEQHHSHDHANSYLSGVFYINADKLTDTISFQDSRYKQLKFSSTKYGLYNSDTWIFAVESKDIIIFPSQTNHFVQEKKHKGTRISLSFNVFLKGELGEVGDLNQLYLN
tara:strand:- start:79 stop:690 length:612 start_codon:yes stop_codon:yes gene_type:complete